MVRGSPPREESRMRAYFLPVDVREGYRRVYSVYPRVNCSREPRVAPSREAVIGRKGTPIMRTT